MPLASVTANWLAGWGTPQGADRNPQATHADWGWTKTGRHDTHAAYVGRITGVTQSFGAVIGAVDFSRHDRDEGDALALLLLD